MPPLKIPLQKSRPQCSKDYGTLLRLPFNSMTPVYDTAYQRIWRSRMCLRLRTSESSNPQSKTFPALLEPTIASSSKLSRTSLHHILASSQSSTTCALILVSDSLDHSQSSLNALDVGRRAGMKRNSRQQTVKSRFLQRDSQPFHLVRSCKQCIGTPKAHTTCDISTNELSRSSTNMKKRTRFQLLTTSLPAGII